MDGAQFFPSVKPALLLDPKPQDGLASF